MLQTLTFVHVSVLSRNRAPDTAAENLFTFFVTTRIFMISAIYSAKKKLRKLLMSMESITFTLEW